MKRISFLILILLFICSCPVMAEEQLPVNNKPEFKYVTTVKPYVYYVDTNRNNIKKPDNDTMIFPVIWYSSDEDILYYGQCIIHFNFQTQEAQYRAYDIVKIKRSTSEILDTNKYNTPWAKLEYDTPVFACGKYINDLLINPKKTD